MSATVRLDTKKMQELIRDTAGRDRWLRGIAWEVNGDVMMSFGESPSKPGDPPGVDTGTLRASMRVEKIRMLLYHVIAATDYAAGLEFGTERVAARPYMRPVIDNWRRKKLKQFIKGLVK